MRILSRLRGRRLDLDEADFRDEIRAHLAIAVQERIAEGADPDEARYAALREFGNVTLTTEATRRVWTPRWLEGLRDLTSDVRYGIRALAKHPAFSLTVIGVLTLGIGLNAAVFTMLKGIVLSPIAGVEGSAQLAVLHGETSAGRAVRLSYPDYRDLRDHDRAFTGLFGSIVAQANLGRGRGARPIWAEFVTGNYFQVLDVGADLGRTLQPSDEVAPGRHPVAVLSEAVWRRDFEGDPDILGTTVEINNRHLTVVGIARRGFHGTTVVYDVEAFIPIVMAPDLGFTFGSSETTAAGVLADRAARLSYPQGYLRPGTSLEEASAQSGALWARLAEQRPLTAATEGLRVVPFVQAPGGAPSFITPTLGVLSVMALLVLMVACANIAGLVAVRGVSRRGEIAVRLALGASRVRIVRLLAVESLALAAPGAALGILLAHYGIPVLAGYAQWLAAPLRIHFNTEVDGLVVGFTVLVACASALLFGFVPALRSSRMELAPAINEDASPRGGAARSRFGAALVVTQVAVSLLLLVGAGLAARSLDAARRAHPGFDAGNLTAIGIDLRQNGYDERRGRVFYRRLLDALDSDSTIEAATLAANVPLNMTDTRRDRLTIAGREVRQDEDLAFMSNAVAPDYFRALRIPMLAGREFEPRDDETAEPVVVVNDTMARRFWGSADGALGRRMRTADGGWRTVIGVAGDVKYSRIDEAPQPYFYLPLLQGYRSHVTLHARGAASRRSEAGTTEQLIAGVSAHLARLDPELPIMSARSMTESTRGALLFLDLSATMLFIFGIAGLALAATGTYGLVSYTVKQRNHEIGIRMALGASGSSVVLHFLGRGLRLGAAGAGLGIAAALGAGRLLQSVLFGVGPTDAASYLQAVAVLLGSVAVATFVPAWRAARTNPLQALRQH